MQQRHADDIAQALEVAGGEAQRHILWGLRPPPAWTTMDSSAHGLLATLATLRPPGFALMARSCVAAALPEFPRSGRCRPKWGLIGLRRESQNPPPNTDQGQEAKGPWIGSVWRGRRWTSATSPNWPGVHAKGGNSGPLPRVAFALPKASGSARAVTACAASSPCLRWT